MRKGLRNPAYRWLIRDQGRVESSATFLGRHDLKWSVAQIARRQKIIPALVYTCLCPSLSLIDGHNFRNFKTKKVLFFRSWIDAIHSMTTFVSKQRYPGLWSQKDSSFAENKISMMAVMEPKNQSKTHPSRLINHTVTILPPETSPRLIDSFPTEEESKYCETKTAMGSSLTDSRRTLPRMKIRLFMKK